MPRSRRPAACAASCPADVPHLVRPHTGLDGDRRSGDTKRLVSRTLTPEPGKDGRLSAVRKYPGHCQRTFRFPSGSPATIEPDQTGGSALTRCAYGFPACVTCWRGWTCPRGRRAAQASRGDPGRLEADRAEQKRPGRRWPPGQRARPTGAFGGQRMGVRHGAHQNLTEPTRVLREAPSMHTTTTPTATLPGGRKPLRARNAAIAALGIVSAAMVAAGVAISGGNRCRMPPPRPPAHQPSRRTCTSTARRPAAAEGDRHDRHAQLRGRPGIGPAPYVPAVTAGRLGLA